MLIVELQKMQNGARRNQKSDVSDAPNGWVTIPAHLEQTAMAHLPFVELLFEDGEIIDVGKGEQTGHPSPAWLPDPQADTDAMLVDHEFRLALLELGGV